jgi:DNA-binding GntR family transcriptional regulator
MKTSTRQRVYDYIWDRLVQGEFTPGEPVLAQSICLALGVSHIPVREAMFQLCAEGLLQRTPRRGMVVSIPKRREIMQLLDVRTTLEARAAEIAAQKITTARLRDLECLVKALGRVVERAVAGGESTRELMFQWGLIDMMFHRVVIRASGNDETLKVVERGVIRMLGFTVPYDEGWAELGEHLQTDYQVHADIADALAQHDEKKARKAMLAHAERAARNLLDRFEWCLRKKSSGDLTPVACPDWLRDLIQEIEEHNLLGASRADREKLPLDESFRRLWRVEGPSRPVKGDLEERKSAIKES